MNENTESTNFNSFKKRTKLTKINGRRDSMQINNFNSGLY